jgi:hypothetical protein
MLTIVQSVGLVKDIPKVKDLVQRIITDAQTALTTSSAQLK